MTDIVLVALVSAGGATLVGIASALASIFGPAWREQRQRKADRVIAADDERYDRARAFLASLADRAGGETWKDTVNMHKRRDEFVSVLRPGEGAVADFASLAIKSVHESSVNQLERLKIVNRASDLLFGWLRGDVADKELTL